MDYLIQDDLKVKYENNIDLLTEIEEQLDPENADSLSAQELRELMDHCLTKLQKVEHPVAAEYIFGMTLGHPNSFVRSKLVGCEGMAALSFCRGNNHKIDHRS